MSKINEIIMTSIVNSFVLILQFVKKMFWRRAILELSHVWRSILMNIWHFLKKYGDNIPLCINIFAETYRKIANCGRGYYFFQALFAAASIWGRLLLESGYN